MSQNLRGPLSCVVLGALVLFGAPPASAARFLDSTDSLGHEEFRALDASEQAQRREKAMRWLRSSKRSVTVESSAEDLRYGLDCAATAVGHCPYLAEAWIQYADVASVLGRLEIAASCLDHARRAIPYDLDANSRDRNLAECERVQALVSYNLADFDASLESALFVIERQPSDWETRLLAARGLVRKGRHDEAFRLIALYPVDGPHAAAASALSGVIELERGRLDAAKSEFSRAAAMGLEDSVFENDRGRLDLALGDHASAAAHFRRAIELQPAFAEARCNLGVAEKRMGDLAAATRTLEALVQTAPGFAPGHFNLAEVYRSRAANGSGAERSEWARRACEQYSLALIAGAPADEVLTRRATLSAYAPDLPTIAEDTEALVSADGVSVHALTVIARHEKEAGRMAEAERLLELATARADATAISYAELGEVRLRRQDALGARAALETACAMDSTLVVSRINLSIACEILRDLPAAWAALDEAIEIDPTHPLVVHRTSSEGRPR